MIANLRRSTFVVIATLAISAALFWLMAHLVTLKPGLPFWIGVLLLWAAIWIGNDALSGLSVSSALATHLRNLAVPAIFGLTLLLLWQLAVKGFGVSLVLLPAPSDIWIRLLTSLPTLKADFIQTFLQKFPDFERCGAGQ